MFFYISILHFYNFHIFNTFFENLLTVRTKWTHFDYIFSNIAQCIYDYTVYLHTWWSITTGTCSVQYTSDKLIDLLICSIQSLVIESTLYLSIPLHQYISYIQCNSVNNSGTVLALLKHLMMTVCCRNLWWRKGAMEIVALFTELYCV
jgi:hypothetical protein